MKSHSGKIQNPKSQFNADGKGAFAKVDLIDTREGAIKPYFSGVVSMNRLPDYDSEYYSLDVLRVDAADHTQAFGHGRDAKQGDYLSAYEGDVMVKEYIGKDHPEYEDCVKLQNEFNNIHKNAPYVVTGRVFADEPDDPDSRWPRYSITEEKAWKPEDVHSLEDAEKWILKNHPDYYMGYGVHQECPSGAFCASAVPCGEYPAGMYENAANRRKYAEMRAEQLGVEIGSVEHEASADKSLGTGNIYDTDFDIK